MTIGNSKLASCQSNSISRQDGRQTAPYSPAPDSDHVLWTRKHLNRRTLGKVGVVSGLPVNRPQAEKIGVNSAFQRSLRDSAIRHSSGTGELGNRDDWK